LIKHAANTNNTIQNSQKPITEPNRLYITSNKTSATANCRRSKDVVANNNNKKAPTINEKREPAEHTNNISD